MMVDTQPIARMYWRYIESFTWMNEGRKKAQKNTKWPKIFMIYHNTCPVSIVSFSINFWPCLISSGSVFLTEPFLNLTLQNSNKQNILTRGNKVHQLCAQRSCFFASSASLTCCCAGCGGYCGLSSVSQRLCPPVDNPAERRLSQG